MNEWSIRVTPPSGQEVQFVMDEFEQFIACKEIGKKHKKLHYHIFCKTTLNAIEIKNYLQLVCDTTNTGNGFFSCTKAHDGTIGYILKEQVNIDGISQYKGFTDKQLNDLFDKSKSYRNQKEAERKSEQRKKVKTQQEMVAAVVAELEGVAAVDSALITQKILSQYMMNGELMPTRSAFERVLNTVIATKYGVNNFALEQYYLPRVYLEEGSYATGSRFSQPIKFS